MGFPRANCHRSTGHLRRGACGLIDTALRQNVHVFHGLAPGRESEKAMGEVQLDGSIHGLLVVYIISWLWWWLMMMVIIWLMMVNNNLIGGIPTYPSEKYESQLGWWLFPIYEKMQNVPNHQSDTVYTRVVFHSQCVKSSEAIWIYSSCIELNWLVVATNPENMS